MSTLTIRIPARKHERLRNLAKAKGVSVNRLIDELATAALTEYDSETRFRARAARGSIGRKFFSNILHYSSVSTKTGKPRRHYD
jgi:hypothetical protein